MALLPFTLAGRIVDYTRASFAPGEAVIRVRAVSADGASTNLLAKTTTFATDSSDWNFAVSVPLASAPCEGYAVAGQILVFEVEDPWGDTWTRLLAPETLRAGTPGEIVTCSLMLADDSDHDGVSDLYVKSLAGQMRRHGIAAYDRNADWDGDGVTNYGEYLAGTNPFSAADCLKVKSMGFETDEKGNRYLVIAFTTVSGRVYSVGGAETLAEEGTWRRESFALDEAGSPSRSYYPVSTGGEERKIYVPVDPAKPSAFFRLNVE